MKLRNNEKPKLRRVMSVVAVLTVIALAAGSATFAKYIINRNDSVAVQTAVFCFESGLLEETPLSFDVYDWSTSEVVIRNFNGLAQAHTDIHYTFTVEADAGNSVGSGCTLLKNGAAYAQAEAATLACGSSVADAFTLSFTGEVGDSFTATARTTAPYRKTISAVFTLCDAKGGTFYSVTGYGSYAVLRVKTGSTGMSLNVTWSSDWLPDNANIMLEEWTTSPQTLTLSANTDYSFVFFRSSGSYFGAVGETAFDASPASVTLP